MADDSNTLPLRERARHFREMAQDAMRSAEAAQTPLAKADFIKLARAWYALATQIEAALGFQIDPDDDATDPSLHYRKPERPL